MSRSNSLLFSSLLRPWTCSSCLHQTRGQVLRMARPAPRLRIQQRARYATAIEPQPLAKKIPVGTLGTVAGRAKPNKRRRRIVLLASTALVGGFLAFSDEGRHLTNAVRRSGRVVITLWLCVREYRTALKFPEDDAEAYSAQLKACHKRCAERTLVTLEKNGSIFIKLGQHLSSLNYLLPTEWCETFIPLQDKCPVSSYESIEAMVRKDTGKELSDYFSEFERQPIGAASLAQVHRAVVKETGERVAVKVQHPHLDEWGPLDLALTRFSFATLKRVFPEYDLTWLSDEMEASLPLELDFALEGKNAIRAREHFAKLPQLPVIIPRVIWAQRRILVMEFQAGKRPDDLAYLDSHQIDRDEVSAALAHIFNEMIFGTNAPLHCDPHGGNIAVRYNPNTHRRLGSNFDIILYDHGLYRDIPMDLRRNYAKLWLAVLEFDEANMRKYAYAVAGIDDQTFPLFASAITGRDFSVLANKSAGGITQRRNGAEKQAIGDALGDGMLAQLVQMLGKVPRVLLLILKTNDLTRSLDENLHTSQGPARTFLILAQYASRTVYEEQLERIRKLGSLFWPRNFLEFVRAWAAQKRVEVRLGVYEGVLRARRALGMKAVEV